VSLECEGENWHQFSFRLCFLAPARSGIVRRSRTWSPVSRFQDFLPDIHHHLSNTRHRLDDRAPSLCLGHLDHHSLPVDFPDARLRQRICSSSPSSTSPPVSRSRSPPACCSRHTIPGLGADLPAYVAYVTFSNISSLERSPRARKYAVCFVLGVQSNQPHQRTLGFEVKSGSSCKRRSAQRTTAPSTTASFSSCKRQTRPSFQRPSDSRPLRLPNPKSLVNLHV
jgi:hypothetical protein